MKAATTRFCRSHQTLKLFVGRSPRWTDGVGAGCVSPVFVGKIEDVGEEIGDVFEWGALSHDYFRDVLALGDGIVPVLDAAAFSEEDVLIVGYVACGVDVWLAGFQIFVDDNAVVDFDSAVGCYFRYWRYADSRYHQFTGGPTGRLQALPHSPCRRLLAP